MPSPLRVVVIGAGFSGTVTAVRLLSLPSDRPVRVALVNRFGPVGRGVAYGTSLDAHRLNVPAGRMSALEEDEGDFLRFAVERDPSISAETYVPRRIYGEYLEFLLGRAERQAPPGRSLERVVGEVVNVRAEGADGSLELLLGDGGRLSADRVVLALGNYSPSHPAIEDASFYDSPRYVRDPWIPGSLDRAPRGEPVLLIGSGLTMLDIALDLHARGPERVLHSVSRHGLTPLPHVEGGGLRIAPAVPDAATAAAYVRALRRSAREAAAAGGDWRDAVGAIRSQTPAFWKALPPVERRRFLRHVRVFWEIHRHRAAPETWRAVEDLRARGRLVISAGRISGFAESGDGVIVRFRRRGRSTVESQRVGAVVNCTGPNANVSTIADRLLSHLLEEGRLVPDPLGLGVETGSEERLIARDGTESEAIHVAGPLLKARYWEATAVPELRRHAARVAAAILEGARA